MDIMRGWRRGQSVKSGRRVTSASLYSQASGFITGGVHSGFRFRSPHPIYFARAKGAWMWDVEDRAYLDCLVSNGACILGHGHPAVKREVKAQLETGLTAGLESELSVEVASLLHRMIPSAEVVKFSNTGTEAVAHAIQIVRGYKKRQKLLKMEGAYHGWLDDMAVSVHPDPAASPRVGPPVPDSEGLVSDVSSRVKVAPFNDAAAVERILRQEAGAFAAVIIEPVMFNSGCVLPRKDYLRELREVTEKHDTLLFFDEVISGFRMAPGGAQEFYGVKPDISVFAKAIANGYPLSAVVGSREVMEVTKPGEGRVAFSGTYNGSQPSLAAARATLKLLRDGDVQKRLHGASAQLANDFNERAHELGVRARLLGIAGQFQPYFTARDVTDYRTAASSDPRKYAAFSSSLHASGILCHPSYLFHHGVSDAHSRREFRLIKKAFGKALGAAKAA